MVANYRRDNDGVVWLYDVTNDEILFKKNFFLGFAESKQTFLSYDQAKAIFFGIVTVLLFFGTKSLFFGMQNQI